MPFHKEHERLVSRLRQLYGHIAVLQTDIAAAGNKLLPMEAEFDDLFEHLTSTDKLKPIEELLDRAAAGMSAAERQQIREITDACIGVSETYVVFFCAMVEAFSLAESVDTGLPLETLVYISNACREVEVAVLAARAQINEMDEDPEAQLRVDGLERQLCQRAGITDRENPLDQDWLAHSLFIWCRWIKSIGFSPSCFLETAEQLEVSSQRVKLVEAIHQAQQARLALFHARVRAEFMADVWRSALDGAHRVAQDKQCVVDAGQRFAVKYRTEEPPIDCAALKLQLDRWDNIDGSKSWMEDDLPFDDLLTRGRLIAKSE